MDAHRGFHVNGKLIKPETLQQKLREELGRRIVWTVYVEADGDSVFEDTVHVMDTIQGLGADVFWITPRMREEWSERRPLPNAREPDPDRIGQVNRAPTEKLHLALGFGRAELRE